MFVVVGIAHVLEGSALSAEMLGNLNRSELFAVYFDVA
jgi:hypothetical protein